MSAAVRIDTEEIFPHLPRAPITEAVLEIRARALAPWEEKVLAPELTSLVPDYPNAKTQWQLAGEFEFRGAELSQPKVTNHGWTGIRVQSKDGLQIAQFIRDRFVFSRLAPYENWERFISEGLRLWNIHTNVAQPAEIQRIGLRFINQLPIPDNEVDLESYYTAAPKSPHGLELPLVRFTHRDTFEVPDHPYVVSITKTTRPPKRDGDPQVTLVLDVDVATRGTRPIPIDGVAQHLPSMRWLKNKAFFGSFTEMAVTPMK